MAVDYSSLLYGTAPTRPELRAQKPNQRLYDGNYQEMYNQQRTMPVSGFAAGSADFLANYAQRNVQAQQAGMSPVNFKSLLGPDGQVDPNAQISNLQKTPQEIFNEAQAEYLARATQQRDIARQGIQAAGQDRYQQARMAMEQQMALSDTRGLTAGAAEGARQSLSATQQVALNQLESTTRSELLNLKAQGVQDEFLAQEWAMQKVQQSNILSENQQIVAALVNEYQNAYAQNNTDKMNTITAQITELTLTDLGIDPSKIKEITDTTTSTAQIRATADEAVQELLETPEELDKWVALGMIAGGALLIGASAALTVTTIGAGAPVGAVGVGKGLLMIGAASAALFFGNSQKSAYNDKTLSVEQKKTRINEIYQEEYNYLISYGFTAEEAQAAIDADRKTLPPAFR